MNKNLCFRLLAEKDELTRHSLIADLPDVIISLFITLL